MVFFCWFTVRLSLILSSGCKNVWLTPFPPLFLIYSFFLVLVNFVECSVISLNLLFFFLNLLFIYESPPLQIFKCLIFLLIKSLVRIRRLGNSANPETENYKKISFYKGSTFSSSQKQPNFFHFFHFFHCLLGPPPSRVT